MDEVLVCDCGNDKYWVIEPKQGQPMTFRCCNCLSERMVTGWVRTYNKKLKKYGEWRVAVHKGGKV